MRAFVFLLFSITAHAAPQGGYNYQVDSSFKSRLTQNQYQIIQQYANQQTNQQQQTQEQPEVQFQLLKAPQVSTKSQAVTQGSQSKAAGDYFANQLVQQAQLANYEQQQQNQVQPIEAATQAVEPTAPQPQQFHQPEPVPEQEVVITQQAPQHHVARHQSIPQYHDHKPIQYNKEFYYLSAPQEDFEQPRELEEQLNSLKKNLRVVFIRAPENNHLADAALKLAQHSMDQRTVVYVLTKQHDAAELANKLQQVHTTSHSKPDVVFIKYRTPEEAAHAQRTIQAQYEALDGPNHTYHEGVAPTHNFVGFPGGHHSSAIHIDPRKQSSKAAEAVEAPSSKYLPASVKS